MAIPTSNYGVDKYVQTHNAKLIVKSAISNLAVELPAFVTDFSQTFDSSWNQEEVYGRVDPIATFQGTKRSISLSLTIPSADAAEASKNFNSCGDLALLLYPGYLDVHAQKSKTSAQPQQGNNNKPNKAKTASQQAKTFEGRVIAKSPLVTVRLANLIKSSKTNAGLLGYITTFSFSPVMEMGFFASSKNLFPKVMNMSFTFNVLHQHDLGFSKGRPIQRNFPF